MNQLELEWKDIYFSEMYAKLFENKEEAATEVFEFESAAGKVRNVFLKRVVPLQMNQETYYDITTPYGYGGPVILESVDEEQLLNDYFTAFHQYCVTHHIVSEFVRFHLFENHSVRQQFYGESMLIGNHITKDLTEPIEEGLHHTILQAVRRSHKLGVEVIFDYTGQYLDDFLAIYTKTMNFHEAKEFYYFDHAFFEQIQQTLAGHFCYVHAALEGKIIASRLIFYGAEYGNFFLGGALREYSTCKASILLDYEIMKELKQKGVHYYIFGGGYSGEDSLYHYKHKLSKHGEVPFFIGKKVHLTCVYDQLVQVRSQKEGFDTATLFFPAYRL